jgi:hypothetical protein
MKMMLSTLAIAAIALGTTALVPTTASAERVCKQVCNGPVCKEECVETTVRERITTEGRDRRDERREERHDERPGIELKAPGVGVEIGR